MLKTCPVTVFNIGFNSQSKNFKGVRVAMKLLVFRQLPKAQSKTSKTSILYPRSTTETWSNKWERYTWKDHIPNYFSIWLQSDTRMVPFYLDMSPTKRMTLVFPDLDDNLSLALCLHTHPLHRSLGKERARNQKSGPYTLQQEYSF